VTSAGQRIGVRVNATLRGDTSYYRLQCKVSSKKKRAVSRGASGHYCKKGSMQIRTFGDKLRLRVTWSAKATPGYDAYSKVKTYKT